MRFWWVLTLRRSFYSKRLLCRDCQQDAQLAWFAFAGRLLFAERSVDDGASRGNNALFVACSLLNFSVLCLAASTAPTTTEGPDKVKANSRGSQKPTEETSTKSNTAIIAIPTTLLMFGALIVGYWDISLWDILSTHFILYENGSSICTNKFSLCVASKEATSNKSNEQS